MYPDTGEFFLIHELLTLYWYIPPDVHTKKSLELFSTNLKGIASKIDPSSIQLSPLSFE